MSLDFLGNLILYAVDIHSNKTSSEEVLSRTEPKRKTSQQARESARLTELRLKHRLKLELLHEQERLRQERENKKIRQEETYIVEEPIRFYEPKPTGNSLVRV